MLFLANFTFDIDLAVMVGDDPVADRKTQSGSFTFWFGGEEGIKYSFQIFRRYPAASILDSNLRRFVHLLQG